jgi:AcrR family transcriptional regulator
MTEVTSPPRRRRRDAIDNERRVRDAARDVFLQQGAAMTMEDVAGAAGVSKGTVYATFGTRQELLDDMTVASFLESEQVFRAAAMSEDSAWTALVDVVLRPHAAFFARPDASAPDAPDGRVHDAFLRARAAFELLLHKGQSEGVLRADVTMEQVQVLFHGLYLALGEYSVQRIAKIRELGIIILRGLLVGPLSADPSN